MASVVKSVQTGIGVGRVYAHGDNHYVFTGRFTVNRVPVEVSVQAEPIGSQVNLGEVRISRLDKPSWDQDYPVAVSWASRLKVEAAARVAVGAVASAEMDRLGTLNLRYQQIELMNERRGRLVAAVAEAQGKVDELDAEVARYREDIARLAVELTPVT